MAYNNFDFRRTSSHLSQDAKPAVFLDDSDSLDDVLVDSSTLMSPDTTTRRDSFATNAPVFSPQWEDFPCPQAERAPETSSNPFAYQSNNPFARLDPAHYGQQAPSWEPVYEQEESGTCTPTATQPFGSFQADFEAGATSFLPQASGTNPFGPVTSMNDNVRPSSVFPGATQSVTTPRPMSPHNNSEWMQLAEQERMNRPMSKRMRPSTPTRSYSPFPRRDGIRKKNARFEIPPERSLTNIDQLISQCSNEEELKELKQQKRLLRNRQAALDSRQRKKAHTESLEKEKGVWGEKVMQLEEQVAQFHLQLEQNFREREELIRIHMEQQHAIQSLNMEKEELVRTHTLESGELRKKISVLTEKLELASQPMSVVPSTSSYADFTADMDNLSMHYDDWNSFVNDPFAEDPTPANAQPVQQTSLVISPKKKGVVFPQSSGDLEKPAASSLLLMLLLCGAFVASKSSGSGAPVIPRMSDEVRAASATVLDSILNDAGVVPAAAVVNQNIIINQVGSVNGLPQGLNWPSGKTTLSGAEFASIAPDANSALESFTNFVGPSKEQEAEQAFSMTASQYNSLTSADFTRQFYGTPPRSPECGSPSQSQHRRNLAEALAAMREETKGERASDIYTKSLLFDQIRPEVVAEFKSMIAESRRLDENGEPMKTET